jgi:hypothetical protein
MTAKVFISYRRDDTRYQARMIHEAFSKVIPRDHVFMDVSSVPIGREFTPILEEWVDHCDVLLALIGPGWIDARDSKTGQRRLDNPSDLTRTEIREALVRGIPVVPVLIDGTPMPEIQRLPDDLKALVLRQAAFVEYRTFEADVERLINSVQFTTDERFTLETIDDVIPVKDVYTDVFLWIILSYRGPFTYHREISGCWRWEEGTRKFIRHSAHNYEN